jgi:hypothetical protein
MYSCGVSIHPLSVTSLLSLCTLLPTHARTHTHTHTHTHTNTRIPHFLSTLSTPIVDASNRGLRVRVGMHATDTCVTLCADDDYLFLICSSMGSGHRGH